MSRFRNAWDALFAMNAPIYVGTNEQYREVRIPEIISGNKRFDLAYSDQIATVYTCCKIYADSVSRMPLNVIKGNVNDKSKLVDKSNYLYPLLHFQPNNFTTTPKFFQTLEYHRQLHGNSFARIWRDGAGRVTRLTILSPSQFIGTKEVRGQLYYMFEEKDENGKQISKKTYNAENILHFYNVSKDGIVGVSPLTALRANLSTNWQAYQTIDNLYKDGLMTTKALKYPNFIPNKKAQKEGVKQFQSEYAGSRNAGKLVTLPDGADLIDLTMSVQDAEFIQTIKFNKSDIASAFRVPLHMVGLLEASKFNSVEMMGLEFLNQGLGDVLKMYRSELESKLLSMDEKMNKLLSLEFNTNAMLELDFKTRIEGYKSLIQNGIMTPNHAAALENWPTYNEGDKHWRPANFLLQEDPPKV